MKTLILGTCYIAAGNEGAQNYSGRVVRLWLDLALKLNPGCDILLVDACSPVDLSKLLGADREGLENVDVHVFDENVGHLNTTGRDGWGKAFCFGVEWAIDRGYEWLAYIDADIIFTKPVGPVIAKMERNGVSFAMPWAQNYGFMENGMMFLNVSMLKAIDFVGTYDWEHRNRGMPIPEMACEEILGDDLFCLPIRAFRDAHGMLTVNNVEHAFPYGMDAITHVRDMRVYEKFIAMKGIEL